MIRKRSRLEAHNFGDRDAAGITTKAATVQRFSQRMLLILAASLTGGTIFSREVTQAYIQSTNLLERTVYVKAPPEIGLPDDV